jgi:hypothetical protein
MIAGLLALTSAAVFFGSAIYVLAVEHVAREALDDRAALMEWQPAYKRGAIMQATISLLSTALGASAWWQTANIGFGIGAILALLPWPWTLLVIKPTNDKLLATSPEVAGAESRRLLVTWGNLHTIRVALGGAATIAFLIGLIQQYSTQ